MSVWVNKVLLYLYSNDVNYIHEQSNQLLTKVFIVWFQISVNEAAAQLCLHMPTLLTRREDLFPLARQVVRDSGYQYSKGHSR